MLGKAVSAMEELQPESFRRLGFDHAVLRLRNQAEIEPAVEMCMQNDIKIAAMESRIESNFEEVLKLAKHAGAVVLVKEFEGVPGLRKLQLWAREKKVPIGILVTNRYEAPGPYTIRDMVMLLHKEGCPDLKIAVDTFDMNVEESSMEGALMDGGRKICHIFLRDNHGGLPGTGMIEFDKLKKVFEVSCPQAPMTVESKDEEALKAAVSYLKGGRPDD